jgi:hypothetical protein
MYGMKLRKKVRTPEQQGDQRQPAEQAALA